MLYCPSSPVSALTQSQRPQHRRCRTISVSNPLTGSASKIIIAVQTGASTSAAHVAAGAGAFTLTGCARSALRGVVLGMSDDETDSNEDWYEDREYTPPQTPERNAFSDQDVPSISRTAPTSESERGPIPPGWGARPRGVRKTQRRRERSRSRERPQHREQATRVHPTLEGLERGSRVGTGHVVCAACGTPGINFPRCTHCAKMWCSRACRTAAVHRCPPRRSQTN